MNNHNEISWTCGTLNIADYRRFNELLLCKWNGQWKLPKYSDSTAFERNVISSRKLLRMRLFMNFARFAVC